MESPFHRSWQLAGLNRDVLAKLVELTRDGLAKSKTTTDLIRQDADMQDIDLGAHDGAAPWQPFESDYWLTLGALGQVRSTDSPPGGLYGSSATMAQDLAFLTSSSFYTHPPAADNDIARQPPYFVPSGEARTSPTVALDDKASANRASHLWQLDMLEAINW
jgi:hypothetical protein